MRQGKWIIAGAAAAFCLVATYGYAARFTDIKGWSSTPVYYSGATGEEGTVSGIDIDGEVGHPLTVWNPTATCEPSHNWTLDAQVVSGSLPPGLDFGKSWQIEGIPTKRGHWIVTVRASNLMCEGSSYMGFTQQLRFHITGTGDVIQ